MKKYSGILLVFLFSLSVFAQSDDELFGSDDDLFGDDGIEIVESVTADNDLSKGTLFEAGAIKIGGKFDTSLGTSTVLYSDDEEEDFGDYIKETAFEPKLSAFLTVDARPTDVLRMYTKLGIGYPFKDTAVTTKTLEPNPFVPDGYTEKYETSSTNWFKMKEIFTDFSAADRAFFRFGLHTVTWGTGYFFSPVSDIINATSINPEDVEAQVDGVVNLRTQITFPDSQNCLWAYIIPSSVKAQETALAAKGDFVFGGWEIGLGGYYKYENAPKAILTASGSIKKFNIFGEFVYQYGGTSEWTQNTDWENKEHIVQATAGLSYTFKDPQITLAGQYYYDGNNKDFTHQYFTYGHNIAALVNFGKILGNTDLTASVFGMVNFGKEELPELYALMINQMGMGSFINTATFSASISYTPFKNFKVSCGPYVTFAAWDDKPTVSLKINAVLGGGKF